jgi:hypothetical protein
MIHIISFNPNNGENHNYWIDVRIEVNDFAQLEQKRKYWEKFYNVPQVNIRYATKEPKL